VYDISSDGLAREWRKSGRLCQKGSGHATLRAGSADQRSYEAVSSDCGLDIRHDHPVHVFASDSAQTHATWAEPEECEEIRKESKAYNCLAMGSI
jgi:hypothetical protein